REYLTGFHKRKVERKKVAIEEIKQRLKEEQKKLREEVQRERAGKCLVLYPPCTEEADELDRLVTAKTESVQYDHPNHTVTVTTISDLDLSGARLLGLPTPEVGLPPSLGEEGTQGQPGLSSESGKPRLRPHQPSSHRISCLTASLHAHSRKKVKKKRLCRAQDTTKKPPSATRTSKTQRRRLTGKARHSGE
ncbi:hypothetical protein MG293_002459, partial [Ovis ammon polii]